MPVQQQTARKWRLLNAGNSAPGAQGLTSRMDERVKGSLDPAKVLSGSISNHGLPTPCAYKLYAFAPYRVRHVPPIPILETAGERELKRLEGYETMLDDTSPSGSCDLQERRRIIMPPPPSKHHPPFGPRKRFAQAAATRDWTLGVAFPRPFCSRFVRRTRVRLRASSFML